MTNKQRYESFLRWEAMIARQVARRKGCSVEDLYKKQQSDWNPEVLWK
mgnify:CR=1|jgi:hypothetical protein